MPPPRFEIILYSDAKSKYPPSPVQVFTPVRTPETTGLIRLRAASSLGAELCLYEFYLLMITP